MDCVSHCPYIVMVVLYHHAHPLSNPLVRFFMGGRIVNYYEIGQRIRRIRKSKGISQEVLAEKVGISTTHMSHIETANTKLSLPVFISIAETLEVSTESLLYDTPREGINDVMLEINAILEGCTVRESRMIAEIVKATKRSFDIYIND